MYFRIETAHSVGRSHNIIFGYRSTEHTGITELLLHPLGDIEYASFIFIGHVLSPDKGIRIAAKLLFERFINGVHHETLLTFDRPRKSVFILLRNIRFGKDKVINALRNRIGCSQRFTIGGSQFFLGGSFYLLEVLFGQALVAQQHPTELHQRIGFLHVCQLILVAIESMLIRVGVRTDTYAIGMYYNRSTVGYSKFTGLGHGIHRVKYILSIAMNDAEVLKTGEVIGHFTIGSLILFRDGNAITVVLKYKNNRKTFVAGPVDSFIDKSLGCGRLTM